MDAYKSTSTNTYTYIKRTSDYGDRDADFCTKMFHSYGVHAAYLNLNHYTYTYIYIYTSNYTFNALLSLN